MTFDAAMQKHREGSLDWWMELDGPPTEYERVERARLMKLIIKTWDAARSFPETGVVSQTQAGFPANQLCGNLVDAAAEVLSTSREDALRFLDVVATNGKRDPDWLEQRLHDYFHNGEWDR